jgi:hypothetical protein
VIDELSMLKIKFKGKKKSASVGYMHVMSKYLIEFAHNCGGVNKRKRNSSFIEFS